MFVIMVQFCTPPDPTLTVENVLEVMEKVTDDKVDEVWRELIEYYMFEDINSKCSTETELMHMCTDIYVNCHADSSWEQVASRLYQAEKTAAVEEVRSYLNPRGRFYQWVWFVVSICISTARSQCIAYTIIGKGISPCIVPVAR